MFGEKYEEEVQGVKYRRQFFHRTVWWNACNVIQEISVYLKLLPKQELLQECTTYRSQLLEEALLNWVEQNVNRSLLEVATLLKSDRDSLVKKLNQQIDKTKQLDKELIQLKSKMASHAGDDLASEAVDIQGVKVIARALENVDPKSLRDTVDQLKNKLGSAALVLATTDEGRVSLVAGVTKDYTDRINAGKLVNFVAARVGGKGGGRPDMAQAGGNNPEELSTALADVPGLGRGTAKIKHQLSKL